LLTAVNNSTKSAYSRGKRRNKHNLTLHRIIVNIIFDSLVKHIILYLEGLSFLHVDQVVQKMNCRLQHRIILSFTAFSVAVAGNVYHENASAKFTFCAAGPTAMHICDIDNT